MISDTAVSATVGALSIHDAVASYHRHHLRAENRSPATIKTYLAALEAFNRYLKRTGMPSRVRATPPR